MGQTRVGSGPRRTDGLVTTPVRRFYSVSRPPLGLQRTLPWGCTSVGRLLGRRPPRVLTSGPTGTWCPPVTGRTRVPLGDGCFRVPWSQFRRPPCVSRGKEDLLSFPGLLGAGVRLAHCRVMSGWRRRRRSRPGTGGRAGRTQVCDEWDVGVEVADSPGPVQGREDPEWVVFSGTRRLG